LAISLKPISGFGQRLGFDPAGTSLGIAATRDQTGPLKHPQVLRDCRLAHRERLGQLQDGRFAGRKPRKDRSPCWIGERRESYIKSIRLSHLYNLAVV
jgi:hypothetical protein